MSSSIWALVTIWNWKVCVCVGGGGDGGGKEEDVIDYNDHKLFLSAFTPYNSLIKQQSLFLHPNPLISFG